MWYITCPDLCDGYCSMPQLCTVGVSMHKRVRIMITCMCGGYYNMLLCASLGGVAACSLITRSDYCLNFIYLLELCLEGACLELKCWLWELYESMGFLTVIVTMFLPRSTMKANTHTITIVNTIHVIIIRGHLLHNLSHNWRAWITVEPLYDEHT